MWCVIMARIIKILLISILCLIVIPLNIKAENMLPGYSEWSEKPTGSPNEVSAIQYGHKLPIEWSPLSTDNPSSFTKDYKVIGQDIKHYAFDGTRRVWSDVNAKSLYTWDFGYKANVTYAYIDVDTYRGGYDDNYQAPPMQLYCDGRKIGSVGTHMTYLKTGHLL